MLYVQKVILWLYCSGIANTTSHTFPGPSASVCFYAFFLQCCKCVQLSFPKTKHFSGLYAVKLPDTTSQPPTDPLKGCVEQPLSGCASGTTRCFWNGKRPFLSPVSVQCSLSFVLFVESGTLVYSPDSASIWKWSSASALCSLLHFLFFLISLSFFPLHCLLLIGIIGTLSLVFQHLPFSIAHQSSSNLFPSPPWLRVSSGTNKMIAPWVKVLASQSDYLS